MVWRRDRRVRARLRRRGRHRRLLPRRPGRRRPGGRGPAAGLAVPDDLAVVAYDDEVAEVGDVPLTAVSPPKSEVGALAAQLLLRRMDAGDDALCHRVEIQPRLVVRASCGAARVTIPG
ncbi:substrate-binding domain-containing protein [Streptomyces sp. M19]